MSYRRKHKYHYKEEKRTHIVFSADPLSLCGPSPTDTTNEKLLENVLRNAGRLKEHKLQAQEREYVLQDLDQICQEWVKESARTHNNPEEFVSNSKVRLFAFGSYKLDVHSLGDDVDLLCVGPNFLTRDMFFDELGTILQSNSCVRQFYAVRNAYVPVMSFKYNSIDIDMVYAQLQIELLDSEWDINDDRNLRNLDQTSILSLNGVRLAHKTLEFMPNKKVFRLSLRAIRYWAKQRGIYSNKLGYLGGVSWAILVGRVCQLYPNANASQIVQNFFLFYHIWNFGTPLKAITLCNIVQHEDMPSIKVWDPNDQTTKYELMHIITPAFPAMNSTHNVSLSTFEVLKREIARAFHMLSRAKREISESKWKDLLARNTFFIDHKNYILVKACAPNKNLTEWGGLIESKIRSFVLSLEQYNDVKVTPFCKAIKYKLKKADVDKHTHSEVLAQMEQKRKEKIKQRKQKKLALKRKKIAAQKRKMEQEKMLKLQQEKAAEMEAKTVKISQKMEIDASDTETPKIMDKNDEKQSENVPKTDEKVIKTEKLSPNTKSTPTKPVISINDGSNDSKDSKPSAQTTNGVVIVSNLSLPIEKIEPIEAEAKAKTKSITPNATVVSTQIMKPTQPSNPYIYVAPELQRKYTFKRRSFGNRFGRRQRFGNRVYNVTNGTPTPAHKNGDKSKGESESKTGDTQGSVSTSNIVSPMLNSHAFVVGKNQIACCESFNNKILREKAEKNVGYECRAFVIGLKVIKRILAIDTTADGDHVEQVQTFDFSRSVVRFLQSLNHVYTDSHIIIELISCHRVPHFLFPQLQYRRPDKEFIKNHQIQIEALHITWKSKSCLATLAEQKQKALTSPVVSSHGTPKSASLKPMSNGVTVVSPKFDADDVLMNEGGMESMPGLGLTPQTQTQTPQTMDVNMCEINTKKRKISTEGTEGEMVSEPAVKKRRVDLETHQSIAVATITDVTVSDVTVTEIESESKGEINYSNPYFEKINWDKKFDNSLTFEYAVKLYRQSQNFSSWNHVCHSLTATATHVYNTCNDGVWKGKLKKVLSNEKYGWNGCKYEVQLSQKLMFDLAHDIAYNYIQHKNEKKRKRKF